MSTPILYLGLDVHKDSVTVAVFAAGDREPRLLEKLPYDLRRIRRLLQRLSKNGEQIRACCEASGAGYVLQRQLTAWGYHCDLCAPSLIPTRPGERRKHDKRDASQLGKHYRDGNLVLIRIPDEAQERVRDLVRCRETFQREILKSRHYILKFLRRRGFVYRDGTNWSQKHFEWIRHLLAQDQVEAEDQVVLSEYLALLEYKLDRREELDRRIEELALTPAYKPVVDRLRCFRGIETHSAMVLATRSATGAASTLRGNSWRIWAWCQPSTPRERGAARGRSPSAATPTADTSWCRPPGAISDVPRSAPI
jgi:transposase